MSGTDSSDPSLLLGSLSTEEEDKHINPAVTELKRALMNEKAAPELLAFEFEIVADLSDKLKTQQSILDESTFGPSDAVFAALYQMEADRIRYLLASYYRTRLQKIKRDMLYLLSEWATCRSLLSPEEREFVQKYADLKGTHFTGTVLESLPTPFKELSEPEMVSPPDLQQWVFCRVLKGVGDYLPPDATVADPITLEAGESLIVKYSTVRDLVKDKSVCLS